MINNTLYAQYISEREDALVLENENGFLTYKIMNQECLVINMFIKPALRKKGEGRFLVSELSDIARAKGCLYITANIYLNDGGATKTLISALMAGFGISAADRGTITIYKNISGGK